MRPISPTRLLLFLLLSVRPLPSAECAGPGKPLQLHSVVRGVIGNLNEKSERVVRDDGEWKALWKRLGLPLNPAPGPPAIDFGKDMVVAVVAGEGRGVVEIEIVRVEQRPGCLLVTVSERGVPKKMSAGQFARFHPFHFVRIPTTGDPVAFSFVKR